MKTAIALNAEIRRLEYLLRALREEFDDFVLAVPGNTLDTIGSYWADTATIDFTYTPATPELKADVRTDSIDNTLLANMAQATVKGRADGAGTGDPTDLTATQLLTILSTVDGAGSGLDADLLDGMSSTAFATASHAHAGEDITSGTVADARIASTITRDSEVFGIVLAADGAGSLLDADLLDGHDTSYFLAAGDFTEAAQDAIGAMVADTTTIDLTYTDATPELKADVRTDSIDNTLLANMATKTYKGRTSALTGDPEDVAAATVAADLQASIDHGSIAGLADDDHTQYALLAGRNGGQSLIGGTASGNDLTLKSTSNATKGNIFFGNAATTTYDEVNERFGINTAAPATTLEVLGNVIISKAGGTPTMTIYNTDAIATGPDVLFTTNGFVAAESGIYLAIDSNNDSTNAALIIGKDAQTSAFTELMRVQENGIVGIANTAPTASLLQVGPGSNTTLNGIQIDMPASNTGYALNVQYNGTEYLRYFARGGSNQFAMQAVDFGNNVAGSGILLARNTNASTEGPAAGYLRWQAASGTNRFCWLDAGSLVRIHTATTTGSSGTPTVSDTAGSVLGDQTSWHEAKNVGGRVTDTEAALQRVLDLKVHEFTYKDSSYKNADGKPQTFTGLVGFDRADWFLKNCGPQQLPALNEVTVIGNLVLAVQALAERLEQMEWDKSH